MLANEPVQLDMGEAVEGWSIDLISEATGLMAVPLAVEAARCARPGEGVGVLVAEQLATFAGDTFTTVMDRWPSLIDATRADHPVVVAVLDYVEATIDRLLAAGFEFAAVAGGVR